MLVFSRGRRGAARALALAPLVRQAIRLLRSSLPATLEIVPEFAPDLPAALLDPVQAEQVLMNLCINARRDARQGTVQVAVTQQAVTGSSVRAAAARRDRQFRRARGGRRGTRNRRGSDGPDVRAFLQHQDTGRGTGMGLAIVHGIVHEHGKAISSWSRAARARASACSSPRRPASRPPRSRRRRRAAPASPLKGRVLLVDDEQMVARFMRELLQGWGLKVTAVTSATEAAGLHARRRGFDVLLTTTRRA